MSPTPNVILNPVYFLVSDAFDAQVPDKGGRADADTPGRRERHGADQGRRRASPRRPQGPGLPLEAAPSQGHPRGRATAALRRPRQQRAHAARGAQALLQGRLLQRALGECSPSPRITCDFHCSS